MKNSKEGNSKIITSIDQSDLSRRKFLQVVGIFTISISSAGLLSCEQGGQGGAAAGCGVVIPPPEGTDPVNDECLGYILVDRAKCQSCYTCMTSCSMVNEGAASFSYSRIQVAVDAFASYPNDVLITQCRQCQDPVCYNACPKKDLAMMIDKEHGNIRLVNPAECIGCGMCLKACEEKFGTARPVVAPHEQFDGAPKSRKCDLCLNAPYHFDPAGGGIDEYDGSGNLVKAKVRTCEAVCPMKAIQFFPLMPAQEGNSGYSVNLRNQKWKQLGFDVTLV